MAERAVNTYNRWKQQLEGQEKFFNEAPDEMLTETMLLVREEALKPVLNNLTCALMECPMDAIETDDHVVLENRYFELMRTIRDLLKTKSAPVLQHHPDKNHGNRDRMDSLRTPKLEIPKFDGSIEKWPRYRDMFTSLVHNNPKLSDMMRFTYLEATFVMPVGQTNVLANFQMAEANYRDAWAAVCERFDDKRRLIAHHMNAILGTKKMSCFSANELLRVIDSFATNLSALGQLGYLVDGSETAEMIMVHLLTSRLDDEVIREWRARNDADVPVWRELMTYMKSLYRRCQDLESKKTVTMQKPFETKPTKAKTFVSSNPDVSKTSGRCQLCEASHGLWMCSKFKAMTIADRWNYVKGKRLCFICLQKGHGAPDCPKKNLKCKSCDGGHGDLLHYERSGEAAQRSRVDPQRLEPSTSGLNAESRTFTPFPMTKKNFVAAESSQGFSAMTSRAFVSMRSQTLLSTVAVLVADAGGTMQTCRALLDSGSEPNFITPACARRLNLEMEKSYLPVIGINGKTTVSKNRVRATIVSRYGPYEKHLEFYVLSDITGELPSRDVDAKTIGIPDDLFLADPKFDRAADCDMLLNNVVFMESMLNGKVELLAGPTMLETKFGWIVGGETKMKSPSMTSLLCSFGRSVKPKVTELEKIEEIDLKLERFLAADEVEFSTTKLTAEETFCENLFVDTTRTGPDGKLIVEMPMKSNYRELGKNFANAKRALAWQETERKKNATYDRLYCEYMDDYIRSGFMTEVEPEEGEVAHYLPHHGVLKMTSTSTKLRPVFNASSKTETGLALNDVLCVGPTIQDESFDLMLRFREKKFVITADIKKMFLQVWVVPEQRKFLRILWRDDMDSPVKHFELNTVTFGTACAPYLAQRSLKFIAQKNESVFPDGAKALDKSFYMDDWIHSTQTIEKGLVERDQLRLMLAKAGMPLCKFSANDRRLIEDLPPALVEQVVEDDETVVTKTLGVVYRVSSDQFSYDLKPMEIKNLKRVDAMSQVASVYDPIGWIGPVLMTAKLFLKKLCLLKLGWNDQLPDDLQEEWNAFRVNLELLNAIRLNRYCFIDNHVKIELHGFSDASIVGYGAVIYALSYDQLGNSRVSLICAKSRVAPKNQKTLARLELCGATLLAKMISRIVGIFTVEIDEVTLWNDSSIALSWMAITPTSRLQTFVGNRVAVIQELTHRFVWKHIRGSENPADVISRGLMPVELDKCELWWNGPRFFQLPKAEWPISMITINEDDPEVKHEMKKALVVLPRNVMLEYIETRWSRPRVLIKVIAWTLRFSIKKKFRPEEKILSLEEKEKAELSIIRTLQKSFFFDEYKILKEARAGDKTVAMPKKSSLCSLAPMMNEDGVIRVGGRLDRCPTLTYDQKHPIILPECVFTTNVIRELHEEHLHPGPQAMLSIVRQRYWPIKAMKMIKRVKRGCLSCLRAKPPITQQFMSDLPVARIAQNPPFSETAVDYAGFYNIKFSLARKSSTTKAYVAVFKCMSTLAIHLELVSDLSAAAFIAAFDRFTARRGLSRKIWCDNGTAFVGADTELKKIVAENNRNVTNYCNERGVDFQFTTPRAPHAGGIYESGVKSMKKHLRVALGTSIFTFEQFSTILCKVEAILNSRPLTPLSDDPNDLRVLTPGHFLIGRSLISKPEKKFTFIPTNRLNRWDELQKIQQQFWRDWQRDYLHQLQKRPVNFRIKFEVAVGDLVLVHESNLPTLKWMLGRVTKLMPGRDKIVRNVMVKTVNGEKSRDVRYLSFLPLEEAIPFEEAECVTFANEIAAN